MAKKKDGPLPPKGEAEKARPSDVVPLITEKQLRALLNSDARHKEELDGVTSELRNEIKAAVDKHHLDKAAYAIVKKFDRMTPEKLAELWPTVLAYMDMAGLMKRIDSVQRLPLGDEKEDVEEASAAVH